ncbi:MAG: hypothetical protein LBS68_02295 [Puniceicoccales bacterium]|jgi:SulP family sulfate permease|nr:hypothetical protein [Puniceicoccales bacterium]
MIAAMGAWFCGLFGGDHRLNNVLSGFVVGIISLPLSMAFAIASGVSPEAGLYTAIVAGMCVSLFGGSPVQIAGPTGAFVPLLAGICENFGPQGLGMATLLAGIILIAMGLARVGGLLKYIPKHVIVGFTAGIGVSLFVGQWHHFCGNYGGSIRPNLPTTVLGLLSLAIFLWVPRIPLIKHLQAPLLVLVVAGGICSAFPMATVATVGTSFGEISSSLPRPAIPGTMHWKFLLQLSGPAFAIAVLCAVESLLSAVVADDMAGTKHRSNRELIGQGIGNLLSPLFGGIAATGAIARTAANVRAGATSPLSGVVCALTLLAILMFCAPLAQFIPLASLAAILLVVARRMVNFSYFFRLLRRNQWARAVVLLITCAFTVSCGLVVALQVGVLLSAIMRRRRKTNPFPGTGERQVPKAKRQSMAPHPSSAG